MVTALVSTSSEVKRKQGSILLIGSGPGSPDLLTYAARQAIDTADVILSDKLVPAAVLALVPRGTELFIANKEPGNSENGQQELIDKALEALNLGKKVVRLKQGDPYLFARGGEEVQMFVKHGYKPVVIPGITSALSAPLFAQIPATHRGVADQFLVMTGTGRKGAFPDFPFHCATRTTVFLMALHRLEELLEALFAKGWPKDLPCAVIDGRVASINA